MHHDFHGNGGAYIAFAIIGVVLAWLLWYQLRHPEYRMFPTWGDIGREIARRPKNDPEGPVDAEGCEPMRPVGKRGRVRRPKDSDGGRRRE